MPFKAKPESENTDIRSIHRVAEVYFVEPNPASVDGFRQLGHYPMATVPRINEVVTITPSISGESQRYRVCEVIHHIPPGRLVGDPSMEHVLSECTCVVSQDIRPGDIDAVVNRLCKSPTTKVSLLPRPFGG